MKKTILGLALVTVILFTGSSSFANELEQGRGNVLRHDLQALSSSYIPEVFDVVVTVPNQVFWNKSYVVKVELKKYSATRCLVFSAALTGPPYFEKKVWVNLKNRKGSASFKFAWDGAVGSSRTMTAWANCGKGAQLLGGQYVSDHLQFIGIR